MNEKKWLDDEIEISGFGGSYEAGCRAMVLAGMKWIDENPTANPAYKGFEGVFGLIMEDNDDAKALTKAVMDATVEMEPGKIVRCGDECTGAMHHAAINHCKAYKRLGWDGYWAELRKEDE